MSPAQTDTLIIDNDDGDSSYHNSDQEEDLESPLYQEDHSSNLIFRDRCTALQCVRRDNEADCQDPVHTEDMDTDNPMFRWVPKNANGESRTTKRKRSPDLYGHFDSAKAFCRSPSPTLTKTGKNKYGELPKPECQIDAFTGQT